MILDFRIKNPLTANYANLGELIFEKTKLAKLE